MQYWQAMIHEPIAFPQRTPIRSSCRLCPQGPRGPPGTLGQESIPGNVGSQEPPEGTGESRRAGYAVASVLQVTGEIGALGGLSEPRSAGLNATRGPQKSILEKKGTRFDEAASQGLPGMQGPPEQNGVISISSRPGMPGEDAQYSLCPLRTTGTKKSSYREGLVTDIQSQISFSSYTKPPSYDSHDDGGGDANYKKRSKKT